MSVPQVQTLSQIPLFHCILEAPASDLSWGPIRYLAKYISEHKKKANVYSNYSMEYVLYTSVGLYTYTRNLYKLLLRFSSDVVSLYMHCLGKHIYFYKANYQYIKHHQSAGVPLLNEATPWRHTEYGMDIVTCS
jgi:hypothetical protein